MEKANTEEQISIRVLPTPAPLTAWRPVISTGNTQGAKVKGSYPASQPIGHGRSPNSLRANDGLAKLRHATSDTQGQDSLQATSGGSCPSRMPKSGASGTASSRLVPPLPSGNPFRVLEGLDDLDWSSDADQDTLSSGIAAQEELPSHTQLGQRKNLDADKMLGGMLQRTKDDIGDANSPATDCIISLNASPCILPMPHVHKEGITSPNPLLALDDLKNDGAAADDSQVKGTTLAYSNAGIRDPRWIALHVPNVMHQLAAPIFATDVPSDPNVGKVFEEVPMKGIREGNNEHAPSKGAVISLPVMFDDMCFPDVPPPSTDDLPKIHAAFVGNRKATSKATKGIQTRGGLRRIASTPALAGETQGAQARAHHMFEGIPDAPVQPSPPTLATDPAPSYSQAVQNSASSVLPQRNNVIADLDASKDRPLKPAAPSVRYPAERQLADPKNSDASSPRQSPLTTEDDEELGAASRVLTQVLTIPGQKPTGLVGKQCNKRGFAARQVSKPDVDGVDLFPWTSLKMTLSSVGMRSSFALLFLYPFGCLWVYFSSL